MVLFMQESLDASHPDYEKGEVGEIFLDLKEIY